MNIALWIVQGLLAVLFLMTGGMKLTQPKDKLITNGRMNALADIPPGLIRVIGLLEVLGAVGIVLPMLLNMLPVITPLAAVGLALTMIGAAIAHLRIKEAPVVNVVLFAMAVFVVVGRLFITPVV